MKSPGLGPINVLYVDRDPGAAGAAIEFIEDENDRFVVETATAAGEALERLDGATFDCVLSEFELPGSNGIEFLESVREAYPALPFILYTGGGSEAVASEAIAAGVTGYVRKEGGPDAYERLANEIVDAVDAAHAERARRRYLRAIENAEEAISIIGEDATFEYVNRAYADLYRYEPEEMVGEDISLIYPEGTIEVAQADIVPTLEKHGFWHGETPGLRADGSTFVEDHTLAKTVGGELICTVRDKSETEGRMEAVEGLHSTVNGLMKAETAQEVAELTVTATDTLVGMSTTATYYYDEERDHLEPTHWNDRADELVGELPTIERGEGVLWTVFETGERQVYADGSTIPGGFHDDGDVRGEILLPLGDHGVLLVGTSEVRRFDETDVALVQTLAAHATTALDGIRSEQALREEREFIDQAISTLNDVFYVVETDGAFRRWNDRLREVSGYPDETIGEMEIGQLFPADDRDDVVETFEEAVETGRATFEAELETAGGERIPYEFASARLTGTDGEVTGIVGIGRDVSRRKERERQLRRQNERLENFSSIVSHDLRNPLNVAEGRLRMLQKEYDHEYLDSIGRAHRRMNSLIDDLLVVAREGETAIDVEPVRLADECDESWSHVETDDATLRVETEREIGADRGRLRQLLENTFRNAVEHAGPDVTVTVGDTDGGFFVEDDGPGIPEADRDRVLEPGYSSTDGGTGLGLSIVAGIADSHGWEASVEEAAEGGARIEFSGVESVA